MSPQIPPEPSGANDPLVDRGLRPLSQEERLQAHEILQLETEFLAALERCAVTKRYALADKAYMLQQAQLRIREARFWALMFVGQ